ncbi:MAG TPA: protease modulator HflC [Phycisphaerae bacterium]|nr:protease modulator HflC [Phycisphaerae bacterium]
MGRNLPTILIALVVIIIIGCMMIAYQVRYTETVVVTRFDRIVDEQPKEPGLHFKWPWPVDRVHRFDKRLRSFETEFHQVATEDQKTVVLTAYATWRIEDAVKFLTAVGREDTAAQKIRDLLDNQVQLVLRSHPFSELINTDPKQMKLDEIERSFLSGIKSFAKDKYGINVVSVGIKRLGLPESVTKDVFARMKEDRQTAIKQLTAEGEAKATEIRVKAEEISKKIIARAEAYAKTLKGQGDAEAAKYYKIFAENPELSAFLKKLETVEAIFESGQITLVLDADKFVPFDILKSVEAVSASPASGEPVGAADRSGKE